MKKIVHRSFTALYPWISSAVAACVIVFFGLKIFMKTTVLSETSQAYIDGAKYMKIELIRTEVLKSLENMSEGNEDIYSSQIKTLDMFLDND